MPKENPNEPKKLRLFVDPASISSGWALFEGTELLKSGTVQVEAKDAVWTRLRHVYYEYLSLANSVEMLKVSEVHIEQLPRRCHIYTHYSVGTIGTAFSPNGCKISGDIPVKSWQAHCDWHGSKKGLEAYQGGVDSEDELAAIGMGLWYTTTKV